MGDYQDTCCVNTNCASLRKCEWNNEAWRCNSYIFGWMGEKTDQEAQVGYEVSCQHDSDCSGDQNNRLKNLGRISVHRCAEACSKTEGCNAIQMDCGTDCYLLPACTRPVRSGCGSHSY